METGPLIQNDSSQEATPRSFNKIDVGAVMFFFAIVELIFLRNFTALIRNHAPLFDLVPAIAFEIGMIVALAQYYRLFLGKHSVMRAESPDRDRLSRGISSLVWMMLVMLIAFSQVEIAYQQIKP